MKYFLSVLLFFILACSLQAKEDSLNDKYISIKGVIQKSNPGERIITITKNDGKNADILVSKDVIVFDCEKKQQLIDFSWNLFSRGIFIDAIGTKKNQSVFYVELGKVPDKFTSVLKDENSGTISSVNPANHTIEVKSKGNKLLFKISSDTVIFDWDTGKMITFQELSAGQNVKIDSIPAFNGIKEAIFLETGDAELYY
jgi:hypothetical protein